MSAAPSKLFYVVEAENTEEVNAVRERLLFSEQHIKTAIERLTALANSFRDPNNLPKRLEYGIVQLGELEKVFRHLVCEPASTPLLEPARYALSELLNYADGRKAG